MKTFRLKSLVIVENREGEVFEHEIPFHEGLIINQEDGQNQWLVEAYLSGSYLDFFSMMQEERDEVMLKVVITKESNAPAYLITSIVGVNQIGENMNVLFQGTIVDKRRATIENMLKELIDDGYEGEKLLNAFKELAIE